jgi:hypothetical protein
MHLGQIKLVDLKRSQIDEEKSDPKKNKYFFKKKVHTKYPFADDAYAYKWNTIDETPNRISPEEEWKILYNFDYVVAGQDSVWPEGAKLDANNHYVFGDAILMKCRIEDYLAKRKKEVAKSEKAYKAEVDKYRASLRRVGRQVKGKVDVDEKTRQDLLGF